MRVDQKMLEAEKRSISRVPSTLKQGFSTSTLLMFYGPSLFTPRDGREVYVLQMATSIPGLYPLGAVTATNNVTTKTISRHYQRSPTGPTHHWLRSSLAQQRPHIVV